MNDMNSDIEPYARFPWDMVTTCRFTARWVTQMLSAGEMAACLAALSA
jgi:hypothetical protein